MGIEGVSAGDAESLKRLARKTILESVNAGIDQRRGIVADAERHVDTHLAGSDRVFLKYTDSTILGFILVQKYWNLSDLFVLPSVHGNGIGRRLVDEARSACKDSGAEFIRVNSSLDAEGFYRRLGFVAHVPENAVPDFVVPLVCNL